MVLDQTPELALVLMCLYTPQECRRTPVGEAVSWSEPWICEKTIIGETVQKRL